MKMLQKCLVEGSYLLDLKAQDLASALHQVLNYVIAKEKLPAECRDEVEKALLTRETQASTAIGHALGVPHVYLDTFKEPTIVFVRLASPINLGAPDGIPTHYLFVLLGPTGKAADHLDTLMHIVRLMSDDEFRYEIGEAKTQQEVLGAFNRFVARNAPKAAGRKTQLRESLHYTGGWFGGIWLDLKRRLPYYVSDFRDGFHPKVFASTLFLYFACLAPSVTFGGVYAELTDSHIGAVEVILATGACGVIYSLFAGQPLVILGSTGPILIFITMLFQLCLLLDLPFLPTFAWTGLWTAGFVLIMAIADASCLMRYFTRFTDELFAAFIATIFILSSVQAIVNFFGEDVRYSTSLLSLILALGTFWIALNLMGFRRSRYLLPRIREFLADFGPTIAIAIMTLVAFQLHEVEIKQLPVPDSFQPTLGGDNPRTWLVDLTAVPQWVWFASALPALLGAVLVFVDQNITVRLVNSREHRLRKGEYYHLDLAVVGAMVGVCSLFGLPWLVAATVRSLNHVRSLATIEEVTTGGETHDRVLHVRENRVSNFLIHLLIGLSLVFLPLLKVIPMAVLYGLFLFVGVVSLKGNQFVQRLSLWLMDSNIYPSTHYTRQVPLRTIHYFTLIQLLGFLTLAAVQISPLGILFPLFIALLVPVRLWMNRFFAPQHLAALDAEEDPEEEEMQWV